MFTDHSCLFAALENDFQGTGRVYDTLDELGILEHSGSRSETVVFGLDLHLNRTELRKAERGDRLKTCLYRDK